MAVVAVEPAAAGAVVPVAVVVKADQQLQPMALIEHLAQRVPYFMVPRYIRFVEDMELLGMKASARLR